MVSEKLSWGEGIINNAAVPSASSPLTSPHTWPKAHMARSRTPKFARAGFDQGYNHQQDTRGARGRPPRAFHGQFNRTPIEAHHDLEGEDENLTRAWDQVRFGSNSNAETDLRTRQSFSFKWIGNCGRIVGSRTVSHPQVHTRAATLPHPIWMRYVPSWTCRVGLECAFVNPETGKKQVQPPNTISPTPRC